jgi:hypothetical protein
MSATKEPSVSPRRGFFTFMEPAVPVVPSGRLDGERALLGRGSRVVPPRDGDESWPIH